MKDTERVKLQSNGLQFTSCLHILTSSWIIISFILFLDACEPSPCQNGGTCVARGDGTFVCNCPSGFIGQLCGHSTGKFELMPLEIL